MKLANRGGLRRELDRISALAAAAAAAIAASMMPGGVASAANKNFVTPGGIVQNGSNWSPTGAPVSSDSLFIGNIIGVENDDALNAANSTYANAHISNGMSLHTGVWPLNFWYSLAITGNTTISGRNSDGIFSYPSSVSVWTDGFAGPDFSTGNLTVSDEAEVDLNLGTMQVNGLANFGVDTNLWGEGTVNLTSNSPLAMVMDGGFVFDSRGITINQLGTGRIDLDGNVGGDEEIYAWKHNPGGTQFAHLTINGDQLADPFDDKIKLGQNNAVNMNLTNGWTMGGTSVLTFTNQNSGFAGPGKVNGSTLTFNGTMAFSGTGLHGQINAPLVLNSTAKANVTQGNRLELNGTTTVNGGSYSVGTDARIDFDGATSIGGGTFITAGNESNSVVNFNGPTKWHGNVTIDGYAKQKGAATVSSNTTITADRFDMDGDIPPKWTINAGLTVNANNLETLLFIPNRVDSDIEINANVVGFPAWLAVNLPAGQTWSAAGELVLDGPASPFVATTLAGSPVRISSSAVASGNNTSTARIDVGLGALFGISSGGSMRLDGGNLADPNTLNGGSFTGNGTLAANVGKALVGYGNVSNPIDFEGNAVLRAKGGTLKLTGPIHDVGVIGTADATGVLDVAFPWNSNVAEKVELLGGQVIGAALVNNKYVTGFGTLAMAHVNNNGSISAAGNSTLTINTPAPSGADLDGSLETGQLLAVNGDIRVFDSPVESFNGTAQVGQGRTLRFENGWTNHGTTTLNGTPAAPAILSAGATQHLGGTLNVNGHGRFIGPTVLASSATVYLDLGGTTPGVDFDQITAAGSVTLDGKLSLAATGGYDPAYLIAHEIMSMGARNGVFATIAGVALSPTKFLAVTYDADSVFVTAALPGDANLSGSVNLADFNILASNFGSNGATWIGGDFTGDGLVNLSDFNALAGNFGLGAAPDGAVGPADWSALAAAVPEPASLGWLISMPLLAHRRRAR